LARGQAASTINNNLRCFHAFLLYLQDQEYPVPQALSTSVKKVRKSSG
jgi:hypothetical protein